MPVSEWMHPHMGIINMLKLFQLVYFEVIELKYSIIFFGNGVFSAFWHHFPLVVSCSNEVVVLRCTFSFFVFLD